MAGPFGPPTCLQPSGDHPGHVGAVAVGVVPAAGLHGPPRGAVPLGADRSLRGEGRVVEMGMAAVDARVQHRPGDPLAAGVVAQLGRAGLHRVDRVA